MLRTALKVTCKCENVSRLESGSPSEQGPSDETMRAIPRPRWCQNAREDARTPDAIVETGVGRKTKRIGVRRTEHPIPFVRAIGQKIRKSSAPIVGSEDSCAKATASASPLPSLS